MAQRLVSMLIACAFVIGYVLPQPAAAQSRRAYLIRDAETEALMKLFAYPIFRAAGLNPKAVRVHLIAQDSINAFVAGGQRIFINTGLLLQADSPGEVIGVLAHEAGHIAGGHLARMQRQLDKASTAAIIGMLVGAAAIVGGAATGTAGVGQAGQGVLIGGNSLVGRSVLSYQRAQEAAADQAAVSYLDRSGQSARGMLTLFEKLSAESIVSLQFADPYVLSHPIPRDRIAFLTRLAKKSSFFDKADPPELKFRHELVKGKLHGFLLAPQEALRKYPTSDKSLRARYARGIAHFRGGDIRNSLAELDYLIKKMPKNPYFREAKGQALFETGNVRKAIAPLQKAAKLAPNNGLIRVLLAQAMLGTEDPKFTKPALKHLKRARRHEGRTSILHKQMAIAYARLGDLGMAQLESAEAAVMQGDLKLAKEQAARAKKKLKRGTPQWVKANDILQLRPNKKN
ncbi:MAG: M48 family metalloprotease [Hyphomicrobiales bacterium]